MKVFAERLRELRKENNISQRQLAGIIGVSSNAVNLWEKEMRVPNANAVVAIAKYFNVSADYLLGISDD